MKKGIRNQSEGPDRTAGPDRSVRSDGTIVQLNNLMSYHLSSVSFPKRFYGLSRLYSFNLPPVACFQLIINAGCTKSDDSKMNIFIHI